MGPLKNGLPSLHPENMTYIEALIARPDLTVRREINEPATHIS